MKRKVIVALLSCIGAVVLVYVMRRRRGGWSRISQTQWEQAEALLRDGRTPETPLDAIIVLADVTSWLQEQ